MISFYISNISSLLKNYKMQLSKKEKCSVFLNQLKRKSMLYFLKCVCSILKNDIELYILTWEDFYQV